MDEMISRRALLEAMKQSISYRMKAQGMDKAVGMVQNAPTIDPVRHGCWTQDTTFRDLYFCDQCLAGEYRKPKFRYCPDCGAKMDAEED